MTFAQFLLEKEDSMSEQKPGELGGDYARDTHREGFGDDYARDGGFSGGGGHEDFTRDPDEEPSEPVPPPAPAR